MPLLNLKELKWRVTFTYLAIFVCILSVAGCTKKPTGVVPDVSNLVTPEPYGREFSPIEKRRFFQWLVREMHEQIFVKKADSVEQIVSWTNVLMQGATLEGVYHGMILSTSYSALEVGRASQEAVRFFAEEYTRLQAGVDTLAGHSKALADDIEKKVMSAPLFTLKRELGERILAEIELKKANRKELTKYYAATASRWAALKIDFGLPERGKAEAAFHAKWAEKNSIGMIQWELLGRMHRILNQLGGIMLPEKTK